MDSPAHLGKGWVVSAAAAIAATDIRQLKIALGAFASLGRVKL
jgi:hypothetical protein